MRPRLLLVLLLASSYTQYVLAAEARQFESTVVAAVTSEEPRARKLLERAVNINSGTMNFEGVRRVGDLFASELKELGFTTRWVDGTPFERAGHLVATHAGKSPKILMIGHLNTVFEPSSPFQRYEAVDANTVRGPGVSDMKGGIVVALTAFRVLAASGRLKDLNIVFVLTGDEEKAGRPLELARAALTEAAAGARVAIGLENAADDPKTAVIARRSSSTWQLDVSATTAHSSQIFRPDIGAGAIYELARILNSFYTELQDEQYLTFNPGVVLGGTQLDFDRTKLQGNTSGKDNIISPIAVATGDLRALSVRQRARAQGRMRAIVARHLPRTEASIKFIDSYPPMSPTDGNRKLLALYDTASRDLGFGPVVAVEPQRAGAADISFIAGSVPMAIDGLGLLGGGSHTPAEFADMRTFKIQASRLTLLLDRLKTSTQAVSN